MASAGGVGGHSFERIGLDHRHVLQGRGVEYQFRPVLIENRPDSRFVADVGDQRAAVDLRVGLSQLQVDLPQRVFAVVQQDQGAGAEGGDLAGEFAADGAAGAGDDDAAALDQPGHAVTVEWHLRAVQQILDRDGAKLDRARLVGIGQRGRAWGLTNLQAEAVGLGDDLGQAGAGQFGGDEDQGPGQAILGLQLGQHGGGIVQRTEDAVALDAAPGLAVGGGEQALDTKCLAAILGQRADEQIGVLDTADQQDGGGVELR